MLDTESYINAILEDLDNPRNLLTEKEIYNFLINSIYGLPPDDSKKNDKALKYELLAFSFSENNLNCDRDYEAYQVPAPSFSDAGTVMEPKNISHITDDMMRYWRSRAAETNNSVMRSRYADLVWNFTRNKGKSGDPEMARTAIDSILLIAEKNRRRNNDYIASKLKRAVSLALGLNDFDRLLKILDAISVIEGSIMNLSDYYLEILHLIHQGYTGSQDHGASYLFGSQKDRTGLQKDESPD